LHSFRRRKAFGEILHIIEKLCYPFLCLIQKGEGNFICGEQRGLAENLAAQKGGYGHKDSNYENDEQNQLLA
jgi:NADH:ubiquinone oxidoreductase subunit F (NADH-binding)